MGGNLAHPNDVFDMRGTPANMTKAPAGSLGQLLLTLPRHVIQHIARFM